MERSTQSYEQLHLPDTTIPVSEQVLTEEEERELDRQDSKAGNNIIARAQAKLGGEIATTHTAAVRFVETDKPAKPITGRHRPGARAQASGGTTPVKDEDISWSNDA